MSNELIGRAARAAEKETLRSHSSYVRHAGLLKGAVEVLLEAESWGENVPVGLVWEVIEKAVGSGARLRAAVAAVAELTPPGQAEQDGQWRAAVVERFATVCEEAGIGAGAQFVVLDARATMPVVAVTGEFSWGPQVLVIPEYAFGVGAEGAELRLSDEHTEYGWFGIEDAGKAVRWDSNRTALWELDHRLRHGSLAGSA